MPLVTLSSDLGWAYAAQMKSVLYRALPPGTVVDLAHDLPAHSIAESAFLLREMAGRFPAGTIHVAVVDPGVGSERAAVALRLRDGGHLVGPDNGLLCPLAARAGVARSVRLEGTRFVRDPRIGATFDGRDLFAPAAIALALGTPVEKLGIPHRLVRFELPEPRRVRGGALGAVLHADRFGNLITNVPSAWLPRGSRRLAARLANGPWSRPTPVRFYQALPAGELGLLPSSFGTLELCLRESSAAERLGAGAGDRIELRWRSHQKEGK